MRIGHYYDGIEIHRNEKIIIVHFLTPHRVLSTCRVNGGMQDGLKKIFNHQGCEPTGHHRSSHGLVISRPEAYLRLLCERHHLPPECAFLGTAANMNCASVASERFRDLEVVAVCTGGVETNAGRAGDPASYYEHGGTFEKVEALSAEEAESPVDASCETRGTINTIVCINQELTPGALVRTVMTATEAKTSVLWELNVPSRYSSGLATGTGTDQIAVACRLTGRQPLTSAGKHSKLGELIGKAVRRALAETLKLQNGLTPESRRSVCLMMERFGTTIDQFKDQVCRGLDTSHIRLFLDNFETIDRDPLTVAAAAALVHLWDQTRWGILPRECLPEWMARYGAQLASAVSGKTLRLSFYEAELEKETVHFDDAFLVRWICRCMALGYQEKWKDI